MKTRETTRATAASWQEEARSARWTEEIAEAVFRAQEAEGISLWAFCQRHGLSYARVRFWQQRRSREQQPLSLVPVRVSGAALPDESGAGGLEMEVSGVRVQVREGASQELISRVVRALKESTAC
ncbi:transposase, Orf 1 [Stigmatella aurantiaca DW4/3-1]|uniref:Transposase, Orf 1 n=1 Tax=Stigmatella aurantiaca (strain DW4/3-1) TaxID=378806 RepID=E3G0H9_STIAD|nr:transposase, Orf 1 [Stigmatella aurantiaca DW4/3-1]